MIHCICSQMSFLWFDSAFLFSMLRCHGARPPPNPEFTLKPKKKKTLQQSECVPGTPCPPCPELVWRSCVGQHIGAERMVCFASSPRLYMSLLFKWFCSNASCITLVPMINCLCCLSNQMVCSDKSEFSCENLCGNPLPCGNHYCTKTCHALESQSSMNQPQRSEPCEDCHLPCQKVLNFLSYFTISAKLISFWLFHFVFSNYSHRF